MKQNIGKQILSSRKENTLQPSQRKRLLLIKDDSDCIIYCKYNVAVFAPYNNAHCFAQSGN